MLKDFRETLYAELQTAEARSEFIQAYFEQDGVVGIHRALRCIAEADLYAKTGVLTPQTPRPAKRLVRRARSKRVLNDADVLRRKLLRHGLDFALTPKSVV